MQSHNCGAAELAGYQPQGPLDPIAAQVAQALSAMSLSAFPIEQTRAGMAVACSPLRNPVMEQVSDHAIVSTGGHAVPVRLYQPTGTARAIIVWAHGGGFALGSIEEIDNFARKLAARSGCVVASVEYRLAPEHKFPAAIEDLEAAALWVAAHHQQLLGARMPVWLGGDSAGGNLATVVTRKLHTAGRATVAGNILVYPCTDSPDAPSLRRFTPPFMTVDDVVWFTDMYLPSPEARIDPDFAPIRSTNLACLPSTLIITAEHDIITEQAEAYGARLRDCGVTVDMVRVPGMIHGFLTLDPFLSGATLDVIDEVSAFLDRHGAER